MSFRTNVQLPCDVTVAYTEATVKLEQPSLGKWLESLRTNSTRLPYHKLMASYSDKCSEDLLDCLLLSKEHIRFRKSLVAVHIYCQSHTHTHTHRLHQWYSNTGLWLGTSPCFLMVENLSRDCGWKTDILQQFYSFSAQQLCLSSPFRATLNSSPFWFLSL